MRRHRGQCGANLRLCVCGQCRRRLLALATARKLSLRKRADLPGQCRRRLLALATCPPPHLNRWTLSLPPLHHSSAAVRSLAHLSQGNCSSCARCSHLGMTCTASAWTASVRRCALSCRTGRTPWARMLWFRCCKALSSCVSCSKEVPSGAPSCLSRAYESRKPSRIFLLIGSRLASSHWRTSVVTWRSSRRTSDVLRIP